MRLRRLRGWLLARAGRALAGVCNAAAFRTWGVK